MKKIFTLNLFFLIIFIGMIAPVKSSGQGFNHIFLLGYTDGVDSYTISKRAWLNFYSNNVTLQPDSFKMKFRATQGNISDANGNFLFASNGCWVADATGDTMMNGSGLNPGIFTDDWCNSAAMPFPHANLIIPYPGDSTRFVLFHQTGNYSVVANASELYYSIIDMTLNGGLGAVILKNQIAFQDTLSPGIAACKHANGRDWWIVTLKDSSNIIYKVLFTPSGISSITTQTIGNFLPLPYRNSGQPTFSPGGTKFAFTYGWGGTNPYRDVRLLNFDRCTGSFDSLSFIPFNDGSTGFGLAFSSNSKYLYHCSLAKIYQINTDTNNIAGTVDTVAVWDGFYSPHPPFGTYFWWMYLAANGKIYVTTGGTIDINFINSPDLPDTTCDVQQHALHLPCYSARASVNHPNYYLGPVTGSICDSLNLSIPEIMHDFRFRMYPNPVSNNILNIGYLLPQNKSGMFQIYDVTEKVVFKYALPAWSNEQNFKLPDLENGVYNCMITSGRERESRKMAVIKE